MKALILATVLFLSGCSVLFVPTWDNTEYNDIINIAAISSGGNCSDERMTRLSGLSTHALLYSEFLPSNENVHEGITEMDKTIQELNRMDNISRVVCDLRLRAIHMMSRSLARTIGGKPR